MNKVENFNVGATKSPEKLQAVAFATALACGGSFEIDMRDSGEAVSSKRAFAKILKDNKDRTLLSGQVVLSAGFEGTEAFARLNEGYIQFKGGAEGEERLATIGQIAKFALLIGALDKNGKLVLNVPVEKNSAAYNHMSTAAKESGIAVVAARSGGGVFVFNPDGTTRHEPESSIKSAVGLRSGCGGGYQPAE